MAGSKRSTRAVSRNKSSSIDNKTSKKKKNTATTRKGSRRGNDEGDDDNDNTNNSLKSTPATASSGDDDDNNANTPNEDNANTKNTKAPFKSSSKKKGGKDHQEEEDQSTTKQPPPPPSSSKQPHQPPAKIKGRFMEVKMKQLTSYFQSSKGPYNSTGAEEDNTAAAAPSPSIHMSKDGGEENESILDDNDSTISELLKKRPFHNNAAETESDHKANLKKRRVDDYGDDSYEGGTDKSDNKGDAVQTDMATTTTQEDPDTPIPPPIRSNGEGGSATEADTTTAVTCPLHLLASAVIISTPDATQTASSSGGDHKVDTIESQMMPKIVPDIPNFGEEIEVKDANSSKINKTATDREHPSIGESTEAEGGDSSANVKCPDANIRGEGDFDQALQQVETAVPSSSQQTPKEKKSPCLPYESLPRILTEVERHKERSTAAVDDDVEVGTNQETTRIEDDAVMDVDVTTETNATEQASQHIEDSANAIMTDAPIHQVGVGAAESPSHPELSASSNNLDSNTAKSAPSVSQLKMALFLEASRVHARCKPERMFANYWDALEKYIAPNNRFSSAVRSDPSFKFNTTLEFFLKTRKMKRLHNGLILALISDSVKDHVPTHRSGDHIPRVWRSRTRHLPLKSDNSVEEVGNLGSSDRLRHNWNSSFGNNADVWSACGNDVTIAPKIGQHEFIAKKREEIEEVSNEEIIPSCRLPGVLQIDLFLRKTASNASLTVSHDSIWLLIVAAREYASNIIGKAIDNDKDVTNGLTSRIPKTDYSSLSCEHLLADKKGGKKKDSKKKDSSGKAGNSKRTELNVSEKKRKILTCADISSQVLQEQNVAAPRLAWMRSMGRGVTHHQPDLEITNDIINASMQRAAIKRRRTADRESAEANVNVNAAPVAAVEGNLHDESALVSEGLHGGVQEEHELQNGPSRKIDDSTPKAPPKSSDLLRSSVPPTKPTTESSAIPAQPGPSQNVDSTTTNPPTTVKVTQIRKLSGFGAKNLAAMKARRGSSLREPEPGASKEDTEKTTCNQTQQQAAVPATQSQQPVPASTSVITNQNTGVEAATSTTPLWQETEKATQSEIDQEDLSQPKPVLISDTSQLRQETETTMPDELPQPKPVAESNTTQLWQETEQSMQSELEQEELPQSKPVAESESNTTQLWQEIEQSMQSQVERES